MRKILLALVCYITAFTTSAQIVVKLYDGKPPGNLNGINKENIVNTGRKKIENISIPEISVFLPINQDSKKAAVLICPGGGYSSLSIYDGGFDIAKEFNKVGVVAIVLKYRTFIDNFYDDYKNTPFNDLERAFEIVKDSAGKWNINIDNVGLMGLSAGGHLASMKAVSTSGFKTAFNLLIYPVISFKDELTSPKTKSRNVLLGNQSTLNEKIKYSSELHVSKSTSPCFLVHAQNDSNVMVQNSIAFYNALLANNVNAEMLIFQKGGHGFAMYNKEQDFYWMPLAINWMKTNEFITK